MASTAIFDGRIGPYVVGHKQDGGALVAWWTEDPEPAGPLSGDVAGRVRRALLSYGGGEITVAQRTVDGGLRAIAGPHMYLRKRDEEDTYRWFEAAGRLESRTDLPVEGDQARLTAELLAERVRGLYEALSEAAGERIDAPALTYQGEEV